MMLDSVQGYVYDRRWRLTKVAGVVGGTYLIGRYVMNRIEDVRENVMQERLAQDHLRRRFQQNQEDVVYTIMALMPTLSQHILEEMDVESITQELQSISKSSRSRLQLPIPEELRPESESSLTSSIEVVPGRDQLTPLDSGSGILSSASEQEESVLADSSTSWVRQLSIDDQSQSQSLVLPSDVLPGLGTSPTLPPVVDSSNDSMGPKLSDSITANSSILSNGNDESSLSQAQIPSSIAASDLPSEASSTTRTKTELWREVKILTFTRTLTTLYSTTLLSLFTSIQLSILGRSKYVLSIQAREQEERIRELVAAESYGHQCMDATIEDSGDSEEEIGKDLEMIYLTLSWWILHVGWKDVGERVRREVEGVFDGVSLKAKLGVVDLFRLVSDVRRRVEHEITFEGGERRIDFVSTLLPPTAETLHHLLTQGGVTTPFSPSVSRTFNSLLDTTRSQISSPNFGRVLEVAVDQATEILFEGLRKNVFTTQDEDLGATGGVRLRLAALLPGLAKWSHLAMNGLPNELVDKLTGLREFEALSAIIFAEFEDRFR